MSHYGLVTLASYAAFGLGWGFGSWEIAVRAGLWVAGLALLLGLHHRSHQLVRVSLVPELGAFLAMASMTLLSFLMPDRAFYPLTGAFFAGAFTLAHLFNASAGLLIWRRVGSIPAGVAWSMVILWLYAAALFSQVLLFPKPAYLSLGISLMVIATVVDNVASQVIKRLLARQVAGVAGLALCLLLGLAGTMPLPAAEPPAHAPGSEDALFAELFGESIPAPGASDMVQVRKIIVNAPRAFDLALITAFNDVLKEASQLTRSNLERGMARIRLRLAESGLFYDSTVHAVLLPSGPDGLESYDVDITVTEGFWWDFNYQAHYLQVAYGNIAGQGKRLVVEMGLNMQGIKWQDPAITYGPFFWDLELSHAILPKRDAAGHLAYVAEQSKASGRLGWHLVDDVAVRLDLSLRYLDFPADFFLYGSPGGPNPAAASLYGFELEDGATRYASLWQLAPALQLDLGHTSFPRRGGLKAQSSARVALAVDPLGQRRPQAQLNLDAELRGDLGPLLRVLLSDRFAWLPNAGGPADVPHPFLVDLGNYRLPYGISSGELANHGRITFSLDELGALSFFSFTQLRFIVSAYYEIGLVRNRNFGPELWGQHNAGFLVDFAFDRPVGRSFGFGLSFPLANIGQILPVKSQSLAGIAPVAFLFEVK